MLHEPSAYEPLLMFYPDYARRRTGRFGALGRGVTCLTAIVVALSTITVRAQSLEAGFEVVRIGVEQGLSQRLVYDIVEDRQGYVWIATREGLNRFDGHRFVVYLHEPGDSTSIPDSKVSSLFEGQDGTLWVGTLTAGLARFDRRTERFQTVPVQNSGLLQPMNEGVMAITEDPAGTLWVTTRLSGLFRLRSGGEALEKIESTVDGKPTLRSSGHQVAFDQAGRLHTQCTTEFDMAGHIGLLNLESHECSLITDLALNGLLSSATRARDGSMVFGAADGLDAGSDRLRVIRWKNRVQWSTAIQASTSRDLLVDGRDRTWLATYSGLFLLSATGKVLHRFTHSPIDYETLSDDRVNAVTQTRDGSIWVATHNGATVFRPRTTPFRAIRARAGDESSLSDSRVNAILESGNGALWVGTSNGLNRRAPGRDRFEQLLEADVPQVASGVQRRIWSLIEADPRTVWIGTANGGLHAIDQASLVFQYQERFRRVLRDYIGMDPFQTDRQPVPFMGLDREGQQWLATGSILVRADPSGGFTPIRMQDPADRAVLQPANVLMQDQEGRYWVGNDLGLHTFDPATGTARPIGRPGIPGEGLSGPVVWTIAESPLTPDALWVGTVGSGLNRYDPATGRFTWYTMADGLPSNTIYGILVDDRGLLWMSTTKGLVRFDPRTGSVERFTQHDGLHDDEFDLMAYHKGAVSGRMWFGGPTGLTEFHPDSVAQREFRYPALISGIEVLDRALPGIANDGDTLRLAHFENSISFRFSAPDLLHPDDAGYRFRLTGYDDDWRSSDARIPEASYTGLPPGEFSFELQAVRPGGSAGGQTTRLLVSVVPAFWQTGWFRLLGLVFAVGLLSWAVSVRQARRSRRAIEAAGREVKLKRLLADREDHERTRLAREIHDGPIQTLYSVNHRLEEASREDLAASRRDIQDLATELRSICERLRPALVANLGLEAALRARVRTLARRSNEVEFSLSVDPACVELDETVETACFRIAEEALSNVAQHSGAARVDIRLDRVQDMVRLTIADDGRGFDLPGDWLQLARDRHYGLVGMRERAEIAGGTFHIHSAVGAGTRIVVEFPGVGTPAVG